MSKQEVEEVNEVKEVKEKKNTRRVGAVVEYPVFAFEKDDRSMYLLESEERILYHLEAIDIENDEYVFWDAAGVGVRISVSVGAWKQKLESVSSCPAPFPLREAFEQYADSLGIIGLSVDGTPLETWTKIQQELSKRPKKKGILARIFARPKR